MRRRLDAELVRRGLFSSREQAQRAVNDRRVLVGGSVAEKPARMVNPGEPIVLVGDRPKFVSRGGDKLAGAITEFGIDPRGIVAFDAGASTGGFTDCLLQHGATGVVAVDVGHGQLHERLRADSRVEVHERVNLRTVDTDTFFNARRFALLVGDLSFISLTAVAANLVALCATRSDIVLLVKPQFESQRADVARGRGIITDPVLWASALERVGSSFSALGAVMMGCMTSPITGTDGNVEFLCHWRLDGQVRTPQTWTEREVSLVDTAVSFATERAALLLASLSSSTDSSEEPLEGTADLALLS